MRTARSLWALGVRKGDHVGILMPNCLDYVEVLLGGALIGAVTVPLNARYRSHELAYVVENADLVMLVTSDIVEEHIDYVALLDDALPGLADAADPMALRVDVAPELRTVVLLGSKAAPGMLNRDEFVALADTVDEAVIDRARQFVRIGDLAIMLYTSGTTANPKGCPNTHEMLIRHTKAGGEPWGVREGDVFWDPLPMFHMSAIFPLMFVLQAGATFLSMTHFEPGAALGQIAAERPTLIYPCFPAITSALFNHPDFATTDMSQVRAMINIAPVDTLEALQAQLPHAAQIGSYGLTEGGGVVSYNDWRESYEDRIRTVGPPVRGTEVRIVDPDTGTVLGPHQPGEIQVRGIGVFEGYYKDPEKTAATLDDEGWLSTGDLCSLDETGKIIYLGRYKEMLKVGGENVAPAEIESFLSTHPAVKLCMVVGVPDARLAEVAAVFVELKEGTTATEEELIGFCRGRIASYKVPRYVRFVTEWPMSATKVQRFRLRDELLAELEGSPVAT